MLRYLQIIFYLAKTNKSLISLRFKSPIFLPFPSWRKFDTRDVLFTKSFAGQNALRLQFSLFFRPFLTHFKNSFGLFAKDQRWLLTRVARRQNDLMRIKPSRRFNLTRKLQPLLLHERTKILHRLLEGILLVTLKLHSRGHVWSVRVVDRRDAWEGAIEHEESRRSNRYLLA